MFKQAQHKAKVANGWAGAVLRTDQPIEQHCTATYNCVSLCNYCREMQRGWAGAMMEVASRSSELKTLKNAEKVKWGPTDRWTDVRTKRGVESRSTRLKKCNKDFQAARASVSQKILVCK